MDKMKLLKELISESRNFKKERIFIKNCLFVRWNLRNQFQKATHINRWACLMVSSQKPNQGQLSIAQQFVDQFPHVNLHDLFLLKTKFSYF